MRRGLRYVCTAMLVMTMVLSGVGASVVLAQEGAMESTVAQPQGTLPVAEFNHDDGSCSIITGGGVYRGEAASLDGVYLNSDFCSGKIWDLYAAACWR